MRIELDEEQLRLYSVAPELLEACKEAARILSFLQDIPKADPLKYIPFSALHEKYKQVKSAIAKAEGRS